MLHFPLNFLSYVKISFYRYKIFLPEQAVNLFLPVNRFTGKKIHNPNCKVDPIESKKVSLCKSPEIYCIMQEVIAPPLCPLKLHSPALQKPGSRVERTTKESALPLPRQSEI